MSSLQAAGTDRQHVRDQGDDEHPDVRSGERNTGVGRPPRSVARSWHSCGMPSARTRPWLAWVTATIALFLGCSSQGSVPATPAAPAGDGGAGLHCPISLTAFCCGRGTVGCPPTWKVASACKGLSGAVTVYSVACSGYFATAATEEGTARDLYSATTGELVALLFNDTCTAGPAILPYDLSCLDQEANSCGPGVDQGPDVLYSCPDGGQPEGGPDVPWDASP
jgi:hypothetical protein